MTVCQAVALRIRELLKIHQITLYKLEQLSGILHGTMSNIMYGRNKSLTLTTIIQISRGFGISYLEFLNSPIMAEENIEIE
jgi:transcriptional regulator with XRE-family HTH domain